MNFGEDMDGILGCKGVQMGKEEIVQSHLRVEYVGEIRASASLRLLEGTGVNVWKRD